MGEVEETEEYEDFDEIYDLEEIETLPIPAGLKKKKLKLLGAKIGIAVNSGGLGPVPTGGSVGPIINNRRRRSLDEDDEVEETEEYEDLEEIETFPYQPDIPCHTNRKKITVNVIREDFQTFLHGRKNQ